MKYEIQDRRRVKNRAVAGAGKFVLWGIRGYPFPHRIWCGSYQTRQAAERAKQIALGGSESR